MSFFKKPSLAKDVFTTASCGTEPENMLDRFKDGFHCGFADKDCGVVKIMAKHWQRDVARLSADNAALTAWKEKAREAIAKAMYCYQCVGNCGFRHCDNYKKLRDLIGGRDAPEPPEVQS
jgi:hypothetical protein